MRGKVENSFVSRGTIFGGAGLCVAGLLVWVGALGDRSSSGFTSNALVSDFAEKASVLEAPFASPRAAHAPAAEPAGISLASATAPATPLVAARTELERAASDSLDGFLYVNHLLDQIQRFAELPVESRVDLDYEDEDSYAYRIEGLPERTSGHFLVGHKPFQRDGKEFHFLQMEVVLDQGEAPAFERDCWRNGPRVHLMIDYDEDLEPNALALIVEREVALKESRKRGVDAFQGTFTSGAGLRANLVGEESTFSSTFGLVNGANVSGPQFPGISPLAGDTRIDKGRVRSLFGALMKHRREVDGSRR